jgi:hypothetical protein
MQTTLLIKDLSVTEELDAKAMTAVVGGLDDQAIGVAGGNSLGMVAVANVGNGSLFKGGPATIQSDNTFTQSAYNTSFASNAALASLGFLPIVAA